MRFGNRFTIRAAVLALQRSFSQVARVVSRFGQPVPRRRLLILVSGALVCTYALSVLWHVMTFPEVGLRCAFTPVINRVYPDYFFPATQPPPEDHDVIVQLGDLKIETWPQFLRKLMDLRSEPVEAHYTPQGESVPESTLREAESRGQTHIAVNGQPLVRLEFRRQQTGALEVIWCRLGSAPLAALVPSILWFCLKIGLFIVGALVFWKRPADRPAAQFFLLCIVTFGAYMGGYHWSRIITQPVLLLVFMVCAVLLPAVSLHFYLIFPRPKPFVVRQPRWTLLAIYGPPLIFLSLLISGYFRVRWVFRGGSASANLAALGPLLYEIQYEAYAYFAVALLWYLASVVCLIHSYRAAANLTERNQVKWILVGALTALVPIGYTLYLAFLEPSDFSGGAAAWPMFAASACFTAAFAVSITRYRLMQLDQILNSGMIYFLISTAAGLVYYAVVVAGMLLVGSRVISGPSLGQALWVSGTALVLMIALDLARGRLMRVLDRHFRREKVHLNRTLQQLSEAVEQLVDPPTLGRRLLHTSAELLGVPRGAVYLRQGASPLYRLADCLGPPPPLTELSSGCPLIEVLALRGTLMLRSRTHTPANPALRQLHFLGGEVAHALIHEGQMRALLVLGPKAEGTYQTEDLNLLAAFAQFTVLALVSAEGHRTIDALNRELQAKVEKIGEQQRRILALQSQLTKLSVVRRPSSAAEEAVVTRVDGEPRTTDHGLWTSGIVGSSPHVQQLLQQVRKVAASQSAVLLRGESGTGKELLARALHEYSPRAAHAFVKVHCAALSPGLLESELFGHVKGAFTGAHRDKIGRFELANGGTLFLDEIGDISLEVQTKLLRVLQEMTFERVGSSEPVQVDVRLIAATHQNLELLISQGRFREDLYYRLNVFPIVVPPLRERREDIPELAQHFLRLYAQRCGKEVTQLDDDALAVLKAYAWPGNIRQLENVIERAVVIAEGPVVTVNELPAELLEAVDGDGLSVGDSMPVLTAAGGVQAERAERERRERERLVRALAAARGNKAEAARALGMARSTLVSRLKKHGLQ